MNELQPTAHHPETPEPRRAVFWFVLIEQYEQLAKKLSETTDPTEVAQAVQDLTRLEQHLMAKRDSDSINPLEAMSLRYLLRDIRETLRGHTFRLEKGIPSVEEQAEYIQKAMYQHQFDEAAELLGILWDQPDARDVHHELSEEFAILEEILSSGFDADGSLLYGKITRNLSGLEYADFPQLPGFFDRQRQLLALLQRVEPYAERDGWTFTWMAMRNHLLRAEAEIHEKAADLVLIELEDSFAELADAKQQARELIDHLDRLKATIDDAGENPPQELTQELSHTELELAKMSQKLELLELSLGGEDLNSLRLVDDNELDAMQHEVNVMRGVLYLEMKELRQHAPPIERTLLRRFVHLFTAEKGNDQAQVQRRSAILDQLYHLDAKSEAIKSRQRTQYLLRAWNAITAMKILPSEDMA